ncbi:hypothetical protein BC936DRAFT_148623 [Jimgerdemannia flammicorona]|uniref:Guanylate kinase-like domain-containing protein n=1 Tax=Jimgerdemannia flammicorona TaxID=994334 RepID=A0A433D2M3_9FUNG|nr:hypothetical protein BC936DRAFT_148623 [Jimgerdemannia flammicorona]
MAVRPHSLSSSHHVRHHQAHRHLRPVGLRQIDAPQAAVRRVPRQVRVQRVAYVVVFRLSCVCRATSSFGVPSRNLRHVSPPPSLSSFPTDTTRAPRDKEVDGKDYHFTTKEAMTREIAEGKFIESATYSGNMYGTYIAISGRGRVENYRIVGDEAFVCSEEVWMY